MKTNKGFIVPLLLGVIALLVIGGGIYIYQNKKAEAPVIVDTNTEQSNQGQQPVNTDNSDIANLKTYSNSSFQFEYPSLVSIKQNGATVILNHSITYKHPNFCDFKGDAPSLDKISDFNVSLMVSNQSLKDTIQNQTSGYSPKEFLENDTLKLSEGFIDKFTVGSLNGFQITSGLEGCGTYIYYFPISATTTLVVNRSFVPELSSVNSDSKTYLSLTGIIPPKQEEEFFLNILSTFKLTQVANTAKINCEKYYNIPYFEHCLISPDGKLAVAATRDGLRIINTTEKMTVLSKSSDDRALVWFSDSQRVLGFNGSFPFSECGFNPPYNCPPDLRSIVIWDIKSGSYNKVAVKTPPLSSNLEWIIPDHTARITARATDGTEGDVYYYTLDLDNNSVLLSGDYHWKP